MSDDILDMINAQLQEATGARRPSMELAVEVVSDSLGLIPGGVVPDIQGPNLWTWVDSRGKTYAVAPSPDHDGYPMLTIRQPIAKALGAWLTTTALLIGQDRTSIMNSITMTAVGHIGAYTGYEAVIKATAVDGVQGGMTKACEIAGKDQAVTSAIAQVVRGEGDGEVN